MNYYNIETHDCQADEHCKVVDHEPGVAEYVPRKVKEWRYRVEADARLLVLQAQQVNRVDEHEAVLHPVQDHLHGNLARVCLGEQEGQDRAIHVVHLNAKDCCSEFTRFRCQEVNLRRLESTRNGGHIC